MSTTRKSILVSKRNTDQGSSRRVAFEDTELPSNAAYENEVALESEDEESKSTNPYSERSTLEHDQEIELQPILVPLADRRNVSTGRLVYIKKMEDTFAERIFIAKTDGPGLFPKLQLDQRTVHRNILNRRKPTIFQQVAKFHHKYGIRHFVLVFALAIYAFLGGLMFLLIEEANEVNQLEQNVKQLEQLSQNLSIAIFEIANVKANETLKRSAVFLIHDFYERMLKVEGKYIGSAYHKYEMLDRLTWNYMSAVFYAMTLFTTIGYGSIACQTIGGKVASVIYSIIGIPMMLVVLSDIGKVLLHWFTAAFNGSRRSIRHLKLKLKRRSNDDKSGLSKIEEADNESLKSWDSDVDVEPFPMYLTVPIIILYLLFCSIIISAFDQSTDLNPGISFGNALYFSFISISTIGLGDVLPNNIEFNPLVALMFLFGLALLSVLNTAVFEKLEKKLMDSVEAMENYLETLHYYRHGREGYMIFKALGPNIQLLALALPLFDDYEERTIEHMLDLENTNYGKQLHPRRTRSMIAQDIRNFRPSLGILNVGSQPKRTRATTFTGSLPVHDPSKNRRRTSTECFTITTGMSTNPHRTQSERSSSLINPNFEASRIRTLSEKLSSSSETSTKQF